MDKTIFQIIQDEDIHTLYQPIVNLLTGEIMGYEALSRGPEWSTLFSPMVLIHEAEIHGLAYELEFLMRKKAFQNLGNMEQNQKLFVNINPSFMKKENMELGRTQELLKEHNLSPRNIVFELTERTMINDYEVFNDVLNHYRKQHYKIAIDDVGAGYSGLRTIREVEPNYIKIDMELIRNIDQDSFKEALISAFLDFSLITNIQLIAEGIETEGELKKLIEMGVHYGQGYFLQRPTNVFQGLRDDIRQVIQLQNTQLGDYHILRDTSSMIGNIVDLKCFVDKEMSCEKVKHFFEQVKCEGICVTSQDKPIGIIMRENLLYILSSQYGLSLYAKKPIKRVMDTDFLMVDYYSSITEVSNKAMSRDKGKTYDIIVITKNGQFYGTLPITSLLKNLLTVETQIAKELNPLTRLPGNSIIHRVLNDVLIYAHDSGVVYLDFDHFKPYNDAYGFENGDQMIKAFAEILTHEVKTKAPLSSFVGHIGGDDFIFVMEASKEVIEEVCLNIIQLFEEMKFRFYTEEDYKRGYYISSNRDNKVEQMKLVTVSIAGFVGCRNRFESVAELSRHISNLKKEAKKIIGNSCYFE